MRVLGIMMVGCLGAAQGVQVAPDQTALRGLASKQTWRKRLDKEYDVCVQGCSDLKVRGYVTKNDIKQTFSEYSLALVTQATETIFTDFDQEGAAQVLDENYIQHNPMVPTGPGVLIGFLPALKEANFQVTLHRTFADANLVVQHSTYDNAEAFGGAHLVGFDVYRVEDGKIAEHWDNLTPVTPPNPSGRTQTDGATEVTDLHKTRENKALVRKFINKAFFEGDMDAAAQLVAPGDNYLQHNSDSGDSFDALLAMFQAMAESGQDFTYTKLHKVIGQGNFVLVMGEAIMGASSVAAYDLFRVEQGLIVEHWDIIQPIPEESANDNGKF